MNYNKSQLIKRKVLAGISATVLVGVLTTNNALADDATLTGQFMTVQNTPVSADVDTLIRTQYLV